MALPISAGLCLSLAGTLAWAGTEGERNGEERGTTVAAGFGYQIGDMSTITVKVYDAATGEVLSDDLYELNVNEENSTGLNTFHERIFAGGVGLGTTELSNFVLRVYDAKTGAFQWEGQLNLMPRDGGEVAQLVSTTGPRRAVLRKVHDVGPAMPQPLFVLRALDASTGGLVWEDEFSAGGTGTGWRSQPVSRLIGQEGNATEAGQTFDFRIRMLDRSGQMMLWEDQISPQPAEEDTHETADDQARLLPVWPRELQQSFPSEAL
jgi:hypothetical protein